jgi:D-inositol-3-phosphate glycosyltransferase
VRISGLPDAGEAVRPVRRLAVLSLHTSPLAQPGSGSAGGMNVLIAQTAIRLGGRGIDVDVFTAAPTPGAPRMVDLAPGVRVHTLVADRPGRRTEDQDRVARFVDAVGDAAPDGGYDLVHSHYWLSGLAGLTLAAGWDAPLVHSAHTWARVKNASRPSGDRPEPAERIAGEDRLVAEAGLLVAATGVEAGQLVALYRADAERIAIVPPGVDTDVFRPPVSGAERAAERSRWGFAPADLVVAFAGRIQPHKGPGVLVEAVGELCRRDPSLPWRVLFVGGRSGSDHAEPDRLRSAAALLGIGDRIRMIPAVPAADLAGVFRAADVVAMPSHSESFGLVALEAQAAGTPVVAAAVGGLTVAVAGGISGLLVPGRRGADWADAIAAIVLDPSRRAAMARAAPGHAARFSWDATVDGLLRCYRCAMHCPRPVACR